MNHTQNLIVPSLTANRSRQYNLLSIPTDRQTDRQTKRKCNTDKNMTSFAELKITVNEIAFQSKAGICTCMSLTLTP